MAIDLDVLRIKVLDLRERRYIQIDIFREKICSDILEFDLLDEALCLCSVVDRITIMAFLTLK